MEFRYIGGPLRAGFENYVQLGQRKGMFDPNYFVVATDQDWRVKGSASGCFGLECNGDSFSDQSGDIRAFVG